MKNGMATNQIVHRREALMTIKAWVLLGAIVLGSTTANAQQYVICVNDFIGCVSQGQVSCAQIKADPYIRGPANEVCNKNGYSGGTAVQVSGSKESGGECGRYKYIVNCR